MKSEKKRIDYAVKQLLSAVNEPDVFTESLRTLCEELFPDSDVQLALVDENGRRKDTTAEPPHRTNIPIRLNGGTIVASTELPVHEEQAVLWLFLSYLSIAVQLGNEQQVSNKLSQMLNTEIDGHHQTNSALTEELAARAGFERKLADYSRKMTEAIVETQEMERRRFARDLHDGIGNTLSMVKLLISTLQQEYQGTDHDMEIFSRVLTLLDLAVTESRQLSRSLTSEMLIEHGLIPTLNEMISRINSSGSIHGDFQVFGLSRPLEKHMEQNLFRIVQELVNNIIKHAHASEFTVQIIRHEEVLIVMVEDDGIGLETTESDHTMKGMGFGNIRTRLNVLNGSMVVDSAKERGTVITIEIPLSGPGTQANSPESSGG